MDSVLTLYSKPGVLKKSPWHNYVDATLVPPSSLAPGEMLKVGKLPRASRAKPGWERYTRETASKDKGVCGVHSALGLSSPRLSSALPDTSRTRRLGLHAKTPRISLQAAEQDLHREGESGPPSSPKPWTEKPRSLLQAGCLRAGCPSQPLSHLRSHSLPDRRPWPSPSLV